MTSRERLLTAMRRQQPDRVPIHMRGVRAWDPEWVASRDPSYRPVIEAVREHCDAVIRPWVGGLYNPLFTGATEDIEEVQLIDSGEWTIRRTILHTAKGDIWRDHWVSKRGYLPLTKKCFIETPEDAERALSVPYRRPTADLSQYFTARDEYPDGLVICEFDQAPAGVHELLGSENFAYWWMEQRELLFRMREVFAERVLDIVEGLLDAGVGPVLGTHGAEYIAPPMHSPQTYREFVLPFFRDLCRRVHDRGCLLHVHCHNSLNAVLEDIAESGWDVTHPLEAPPMGDVVLADAKRRIGDRVCIEGNLQIGDIYASPTEEVVRLVTEAMEAGKPGGGFILCPTASPHTPQLTDLTVRNYLAMIETAVKLRDY